jgi:hypothetical protein
MSAQAQQINAFAKIQTIQTKFHLARQATFLTGGAAVVLVLGIIDVILWHLLYNGYDGYYTPSDIIWLIILSLITIVFSSMFLARERALASHPDYQVSYPKVIAPIILTIAWFSASVSPISYGSVSVCIILHAACGPVGAIMDLCSWIVFGMFVTFTVTVIGQAQKQQLFFRGAAVPLQTIPVQQSPYPYGGAPGSFPAGQANPYGAPANPYGAPASPYDSQQQYAAQGTYPPPAEYATPASPYVASASPYDAKQTYPPPAEGYQQPAPGQYYTPNQ